MKRLQERGKIVLFLDLKDSLTEDRLIGIDKESLLIAKPTSYQDILGLIANINEEEPQSLIVIDGIELLPEFREGDTDPFVVNIIRYCNNSTVIVTQTKGHVSSKWSFIVEVTKKEMVRYEDETGTYIGYLTEIEGPVGKSIVLINYTPGLVSEGYEKAVELKEEKGVPPKGVYEYDRRKVRGFWNFVREYDKSQGTTPTIL